MKRFKQLALGATLAAGSMMTSMSVMAAHVPGLGFSELTFNFDATAYGGGVATGVKFIDYSYTGEVDQVAGVFTETGGGFFGTFREELGSAPIPNGIGTDYNFYWTFDADGFVMPSAILGAIDVFFTRFDVKFFIDPSRDSSFATITPGGVDESTTVLGAVDDVEILSGTLIVGGAHVSAGLAGGDFDIEFTVDTFDASIFSGAAFEETSITGDINGVNTRISGLGTPGDDFTDALLTGSGNASFTAAPVPEPASLVLLGMGLLGLSATKRNSFKKG